TSDPSAASSTRSNRTSGGANAPPATRASLQPEPRSSRSSSRAATIPEACHRITPASTTSPAASGSHRPHARGRRMLISVESCPAKRSVHLTGGRGTDGTALAGPAAQQAGRDAGRGRIALAAALAHSQLEAAREGLTLKHVDQVGERFRVLVDVTAFALE